MPPDFLIIGAPKAGTTWLYRNLEANPALFLAANKEPRYYCADEGEPLALADGKADAIEQRLTADAHAEILEFKQRHGTPPAAARDRHCRASPDLRD